LIDLPPVIGHRGAAGLAPENTLAGFRLARTLGVAWVEFDVRLTADRRCVVLHDATLDRTTDASGPVGAMSLDAVSACDAGSWFAPDFVGERVPTLEETIDLLFDLGLGANIELKAEAGEESDLARAACRIIAGMWQAGAPDPIVSSFSVETLDAARRAEADLPRGLLLDGDPSGWHDRALAVEATTIHCRHSRLSRARTAEMRAAGFPVLAYTVNHAGRLRELLSWGVTSVFSDRPDRLLGFASPSESRI